MIVYDQINKVFLETSINLYHGFTTTNCGFNYTLADQELFFKRSHFKLYDQSRYFSAEQTHGNIIRVVTSPSSKKVTEVELADGLLYQSNNLFKSVCLYVHTSDCLPILLTSAKDRLIGVLHLGWQGASRGLLISLKQKLRALNIDLRFLRVVFGPAINGACYNIKMERVNLFKKFPSHDSFLFKNGSHYFLSLKQFAYSELLRIGVLKTNFSWRLDCTHCQSNFFYSYRRLDRQMNLISYIYSYD